MMLRTHAVLAALALSLTSACGGYSPSDVDPEARGISPGDATLERLELSLDAQGAEVELFFTSPAGCPVVPSTFAAQLNGQALAVQSPGRFGWVTRPACAAGEQGPGCEGTVVTLGCEAPQATVTLPGGALVDGPLELQVGDARFSYPVSLSALAWHVVPTTDGNLQLSWGGSIVPASTKALVQRPSAPTREAHSASTTEMRVGDLTSGPGRVELVTSVVVTAPGAPAINLTVRQVLALP